MSFGKFDILYSEVSDDFVDGDMTVGEYELAQRFPLEYDLRVNGIKHIYVNDLSQGIRYIWVDGKLINIEEGVF